MKHVIVLNGPARSGKDTIADAVVAALFDSPTPAVKVKFAGSLKDGVAGFMGLTDPERQFFFETMAKDVVSPRFFDTTPRQVLISFSEDWVKPNFGKQTFGEILGHRIKSPLYANYQVFVVSDGGFNEEVVGLREVLGEGYDVRVVHLCREGTSFTGDSRGWIENPFATVYNNDTPEEVARRVASLLRE